MFTPNNPEAPKPAKKKIIKRGKKPTTLVVPDLSPKMPVLLVEDQDIAVKKAIEGLNSSHYSYQGTTYQAELQGYHYLKPNRRDEKKNNKTIADDLDVFKYIKDPATPFPAIAVFDNTLGGKILGLQLAYFFNLSPETLQELASQELKENSPLVDKQGQTIFTAEEIAHLQKNSINYREFLQSLATKKSQSLFPFFIVIYTDEKEKYGSVPLFMRESLHAAENVSKIFPKAGFDASNPKDFQYAISHPNISGASKPVIYTAVPKTQEVKLNTPESKSPSLKRKTKEEATSESPSSSTTLVTTILGAGSSVEFKTLNLNSPPRKGNISPEPSVIPASPDPSPISSVPSTPLSHFRTKKNSDDNSTTSPTTNERTSSNNIF